MPVQAVLVTAGEEVSFTAITGTFQARNRATLAAKLTGAIEEIPLVLGQRVRAGDVLVRIAAGDVSARVAQAQTQLTTARRDLERERKLLTQGASTDETVRNLEDRATTATAQLREAEVLLGYSILRAPFDGVITRRHAHAGDLATPGMPLLEIHGDDAFEIEAAVPETAAALLKPGTSLPVTIPATEVNFSATVAELSSAADTTARAVPVKLSVPPGTKVNSGQFARVQLPTGTRSVIRVPASAVAVVGQMERVFTIDAANRAALRLVRTGSRAEAGVEILAGLNAGERVIIAPPAALRDGQPVEVRP